MDARADQYSLAAVCYELLTGQLPLGAFPLPSAANARLHAAVDEVLGRALSEDRDDRYPTINDFGTALDAVLAMPGPRHHRTVTLVTAGAIVVSSLAGFAALPWLFTAPKPVAHAPGPGSGHAAHAAEAHGSRRPRCRLPLHPPSQSVIPRPSTIR